MKKLFIATQSKIPYDVVGVKNILITIVTNGIEGIVKYYRKKGMKIFIDSGGYTFAKQKKIPTAKEIINLQRKLNPDYYAVLDYPPISEDENENWKRLDITIKNNKYYANLNDDRVVYVIQGWDVESYKYCWEEIKDLGNYYAIGNIAYTSRIMTFKNSLNNFNTYLKKIIEIIDKKVKIHLFGIASSNIIKTISEKIYSVDVCVEALASFYAIYNTQGKRTTIDKKLINDKGPYIKLLSIISAYNLICLYKNQTKNNTSLFSFINPNTIKIRIVDLPENKKEITIVSYSGEKIKLEKGKEITVDKLTAETLIKKGVAQLV